MKGKVYKKQVEEKSTEHNHLPVFLELGRTNPLLNTINRRSLYHTQLAPSTVKFNIVNGTIPPKIFQL